MEAAAQVDRDHIIKVINDQVIQRLFSLGLELQRTASGVGDAATAATIVGLVDSVDEAIRHVRDELYTMFDQVEPSGSH